jgi:hypothetical protein
MKSKWYELKESAIGLRQSGMSMTVIERRLGIPRSTLSGWFKNVTLTTDQKVLLQKNSKDGWKRARKSALEWHKTQKALRLQQAEKEARKVINEINLTPAILDVAFAMLYFGEGAKSGSTSIANSDPIILNFVLNVLELNYKITRNLVRCELHIRADQDPITLKLYWSQELNVPLDRFRGVYVDQRSAGRPTYESYKGVCVLYCGSISIQRKLIKLYNLFCEKVANLDTWARSSVG